MKFPSTAVEAIYVFYGLLRIAMLRAMLAISKDFDREVTRAGSKL